LAKYDLVGSEDEEPKGKGAEKAKETSTAKNNVSHSRYTNRGE